MGGWGRQNPWPFQWGGGRSAFEQAWMSLRAMLGPKGPGPIGGLEDGWREAKVSGIVKVLTMAERAAMQALPQSATDHIPVYEELLHLSPGQLSDQERRDAISLIWSGVLSALIPELRAALQTIDTDLDVIMPLDIDKTANFQFGQAFRNPGGEEFGTWPTTQNESDYPNYANHFILYVLYSNQPVATGPDANKIAAVEDMLRERLPSWVDYVIITSVGFLAGTSPVGWTGLAEEPIRELVDGATVSDVVDARFL